MLKLQIMLGASNMLPPCNAKRHLDPAFTFAARATVLQHAQLLGQQRQQLMHESTRARFGSVICSTAIQVEPCARKGKAAHRIASAGMPRARHAYDDGSIGAQHQRPRLMRQRQRSKRSPANHLEGASGRCTHAKSSLGFLMADF